MSVHHDDELDAAIDRTVRDMLDVEPSPALRARVMERLERPHSSWGWMWIAAPAVAAAILVVLIWLPAARPRVQTNTVASIAQAPATPPVASHVVTGAGAAPLSRGSEPAAPATRQVAARGAIPVGMDNPGATVPPLAAPAPMAIAPLETVVASELSPVGPPPLEVTALEVRPLSDSRESGGSRR